MDSKPLSRCLCCGSGDLQLVLNLGRQPLANSYLKGPADLPTFPLELILCRSCCHNQLSVAVEPDLMFRQYLYVSGTTRTLREHFTGLARDAFQWITPRPRRALDLACNDGTLLEVFREEGCEVYGVDPAHNLVALAADKGLRVAEGYWPQIRPATGGPFDLITAANVLAHVAYPGAFLDAALDALTDTGAVVVEVPYCRDMVLRCEWDTIYHEHLSYFLVAPLLRLLDRLGAVVTHARRAPIHGGGLRLAIQRGSGPHCDEVLALAEAERQDGLHNPSTYQEFACRVAVNCRDLLHLVAPLVASGQRVIGYGASAKGNTLLNHCPLPLAYIIDDNPLKHGYLTPGQAIPIRAPEAVLTEGPGLHVVLLAWNFAREIQVRWRARRAGKDDQMIHYVPRVSPMPLTLISHFWNEEFLLPYWLRQHVPIFDHGVLLDYGSTDRSLEIIHELAPGWDVRPSRNPCFDARDVDAEVMEVEREFKGWKVVLNTTEFLLCHDLPLYIRWMEKYRPDVKGVWAFDLAMVDPLSERDREVTGAPLHFQKRWGYHPTGNQSRSRLLHRFPDGQYHAGRHATPLLERAPDDGLFVLWFAWSPMRYVAGRKLQIQQRMSARDRAEGLGRQHLVTPEGLEAAYRQEAARACDLLEAHPSYRELIQALARKEGVVV